MHFQRSTPTYSEKHPYTEWERLLTTKKQTSRKATKPALKTNPLPHIQTLPRYKTLPWNEKYLGSTSPTRPPSNRLNNGLHPHRWIRRRKPKLPPRNSKKRPRSRRTNRQRMDVCLHNATKRNDVQKTQIETNEKTLLFSFHSSSSPFGFRARFASRSFTITNLITTTQKWPNSSIARALTI